MLWEPGQSRSRHESVTQHHHSRGRLAPSPTGAQHVGNARTYLIAWLSARSQVRSTSLANRGHRLAAHQAGRGGPQPATTCAGSASTGTANRSSKRNGLRLYEAALAATARSRTRLPVHLHAHRHRAGGQRPARRTRRARPTRAPARIDVPPTPTRLAIGRSPGDSACTRFARVRRWLSRPDRDRPFANSAATSSSGSRPARRPISSPSWSMTPRWGSPRSFAATISFRPHRDSCCSTRRSG